MPKTIFFIVILIVGVVAYTGIDVTSKYDDSSKIRNQVLDDMIDPIAKKILTYASDSNLDEIIGSTITKHGNGV
jgi:hypothetical protein